MCSCPCIASKQSWLCMSTSRLVASRCTAPSDGVGRANADSVNSVSLLTFSYKHMEYATAKLRLEGWIYIKGAIIKGKKNNTIV